MPEITVQFGDATRTYPSKKAMLKQVGRAFLADAEEPMTLRQLYYRFVGHDLVENKQSQYQYLSEAIKEARLAGEIPWDWIEDRTRDTLAGDVDAVSPDARFDRELSWFKTMPMRHKRPRWEGQPVYLEVWVEKEALAGIVSRIADDLGVVAYPSKGYSSISMLHDAAVRFADVLENDDAVEEARILYFGDFDPSGKDIERNIRERFVDTFGVPAWLERQALTVDQIEEWELPPQPAKRTDARFEDFVAEHGDMAVELDALPPDELRRLIRESVDAHYDESIYEDEVLPRQNEERRYLRNRVDEVLDETN